MSEAIERTIQYATVVDTLPDAWAFVMGHVDSVGPRPQITVSPVSWYSENEQYLERFEVSVSGMTEVKE